MPEAITRSALWLSLGGWVGSWAFFAFVVSRVAFRELPGDVAGDLAGMLLAVLHWGGAGLALVAAAAAAALGRKGWFIGLPVVLAILCACSELFLAPEVAAVRPSALAAAANEATSRRFGLLHATSLGLFMLIHAISLGLVVAHARLDARTKR